VYGARMEGIAIIGMAARFPGAQTIEAFWRNLCAGRESISFFSSEELAAAGVDPALARAPRYVPATGMLEDVDLFDAAFFGFAPREAELMDPQHRLLLECAWEALERAGHAASRYRGRIGVYAGAGMSEYLLCNILSGGPPDWMALYQIMIGSGASPLTTQISYKLNLRGPSVAINTACSTSLVAIHLACQSLLNVECDMALAGGVRVQVPQKAGHLYVEGHILSPDGHCRAFDERAQGVVGGSGVGLVVLKRLEDALADGDIIHAVIKGSAINNDGSAKIGYAAPSVDGQAAVISEAQAIADIKPGTFGYIEAHGTGTALGDPIEVAALNQVFTESGAWRRDSCALGSVKTNIGHLDAAAGVAGLIKTTLALEHGKIPPSLHFERPNPRIDFEGGPFYVNASLSDWPASSEPRRAGVSSLGIGGTNAHVVLEEAPAAEPSGPSRSNHVVLLSAKTESALEAATGRLAEHLVSRPDQSLADVAYTLQVGREAFEHRQIMVCQDLDDAAAALGRRDPARLFRGQARERPRVRFMFPGQGAQHVNMARELYESEPSFRADIGRCSALLAPLLGLSLADVLYPAAETSGDLLNETRIAQPALFTVEYALARLWMSWGVQPDAMIGHSIGEYVAACLSDVLSLEDALPLVAARGAMMQRLPRGAMLAVSLPEGEIAPLLGSDCAVAAYNAPSSSVISGPISAIDELSRSLGERGITCSRLRTSHAFHSKMMEPILGAFAEEVKKARRRAPRIPYISNLTGSFIEASDTTSVRYWAAQLREPVRFAEGIQRLLDDPGAILLEVGPGITLSTLARQHPAAKGRVVFSSLRNVKAERSDASLMLETLGRLWVEGVPVDWQGFHAPARRRRVVLPTYPFERKRFWIEPTRTGRPPNAVLSAPAVQEPHESAQREQEQRPRGMATHVSPRDASEQAVAEIMARALGIEQPGIHDDFFALGGSSLLAVQVTAKLREVLQVELTSHDLLRAPTIAGLSMIIKASRERGEASAAMSQRTSELVEIKPGVRTRRPLFLVHPAGGHVYFYQALARALTPEQPVFGFQARGIAAGTRPSTSIEEMASRYVGLLREVQPTGPYLLGGASLGGAVAYEMAQKLADAGERTALLALLDTPGRGQWPARLQDQAEILVYLADIVAPGHSLSLESLRQLDDDEQIRRALIYMRRSGLVPEEIDYDEARRLLTVFAANMKALFDYTPQPYPGQMVFFRARERRAQYDPPNPELAWLDLATGGTTFHIVPGDHISMNAEPHVRIVADWLQKYVDAAQRPPTT